MKPVCFLGDSLRRLRDFPHAARQDAGYQLDRLQRGLRPQDSRPMPGIGSGVEEIRIWDASGTYRVLYTARRAEAVYVLHALHKKTQAAVKADLDLARARYAALMRDKP